jgi:glycolate oxidase
MAKSKATAKRAVTKPAAGEEILTTTELVALAKKRLPEAAWDFVVGGAETETTMIRNRHALDSIAFRPRVLRNVEDASPATTFLGAKQRIPVLLAPIASLTDVDPEGALPVARAAATFGCLMLVSSVTQPSFPRSGAASGTSIAATQWRAGRSARSVAARRIAAAPIGSSSRSSRAP